MMANEKRLIPCGEKCTLDELRPGTIFAFGDDCIAVKSEYRCNNGLIEAFIIDSGEQFWGGVHTAEEQNALMVQPLEIEEVDAVEVVHGRWERCGGDIHSSGYAVYCSVCHKNHFVHYKYSLGGLYGCKELFELPNYCPNCGAKMDGGNEDG